MSWYRAMVVWCRSASLSWLANFIFLQSSYACLCFQEVLWPEFSIWNFFSAILSYQRNCDAIQVSTSCLCSSLERFHYDIASCISRWPEITILKREDNCSLRQIGSVFLMSWSVAEQTPLHPFLPVTWSKWSKTMQPQEKGEWEDFWNMWRWSIGHF